MLTSFRIITEAPKAWSYLNGIVALYKPSGLSTSRVQSTIIGNICRDLNAMKVRPPKRRMIEASSGDGVGKCLVSHQDLADHVLVVGDRYQPQDFKATPVIRLGSFTSGLLLLGINRVGIKTAYMLRENRPVKVYHVTGKFGMATESHFPQSPVTIRASYDHITLNKLCSYLASLQASHQKKMYEMCGVDLQSQAAFELAAQGLIRPGEKDVPVIYSLRCIEYKKPYFTIEIHALNEHEAYLGILIHEIAIDLKSVAHCTQIRCIRQSHFSLEDSLVRRHWNIENIITNITRSKKKIIANPEMLEQEDPTLVEKHSNTEEKRIEQ